MSAYQEVKDALNSVLGPTPNTNVQSLTGATEILISGLPGELSDICFIATASVAVNLGYQDASATATGTARFFQIRNVAAGIWAVNFSKPIQYTRGLVLSYTASGAATVDVNTIFTPRSAGNTLLPWAAGLR